MEDRSDNLYFICEIIAQYLVASSLVRNTIASSGSSRSGAPAPANVMEYHG